MRIAIANAKGGVAKTTSSIYIASVIVSRGGRAVVYDADPQSSASLWAAAAEQTADPLTFDVLPANQATLRQLAAGADPDEWAIIDAPPQGPTLDMAIKAADFVIVPASDSPMDLQQAWSTLDMARMSTPAALLLVKAEHNTKAFRDTMDALNAMDTPRFDTIVPKAQSYKRSLGTNPHQLGEYRDLVTELQQIAGKQE
ncbi:chromosome partitioning protein parA [Bifidobacterium sp. DSM 109958]|uniref:Chromosome partitioning ATPase n=2 Tax=Bifidobacterium TaxID=1678 RepID=A0A087ABL5_9BIFI|nr:MULTISPECIES: ParA family protein [Bifidobacterium]KFI56165.1 chromosome partitioning ATPase [Bifidobacterium callitrichos DSM 23973]NMN01315.1 chromosome partitioning protein parA [Bifidobacterium sp. DSM 109958]